MKLRLTAVSAALILVATSNAVWAHAHLRSETPAANTVGTSPTTLSLTFSEGIEIQLSGIVLTGPDGKNIAVGAAMLDANDDKLLHVSSLSRLSPGQYTVEWHALAKDGHATHGSYSFTVAP